MRGVEEEAAFVGRLRNLVGRHDCCQRQPRAKRLRQDQDIRHHPVTLERAHRAGASHPGLRFVEDQQHAAFGAFLLQGGKIPFWQFDNAAAAQDRLGDKRGEVAGALPVKQIESIIELRLSIDAGKAGAIGVWRGNGETTGRHRTVAATAGLVGGRRGSAAYAVP